MPNLYIIGGSNGSGKTTASYTVLPEMLNCEEFINADEIAKGLSPFNPDKVSIEAGRIMLKRIKEAIIKQHDFAFETTLSTKSHVKRIEKAKANKYEITLLFLFLDSVNLAIERVKTRVNEGGHDIPEKVIKRRYFSGLKNLFDLYMPICDYWMITNNSNPSLELIAEGNDSNINRIENSPKFELMKKMANGNE
jgi:predicted ABC-type ATPase